MSCFAAFGCHRFLEKYETMYQEASKDVSKYLANPVNAYLLVKRLTSDWRQIEGVMVQNIGSGTLLLIFFIFHIVTQF